MHIIIGHNSSGVDVIHVVTDYSDTAITAALCCYDSETSIDIFFQTEVYHDIVIEAHCDIIEGYDDIDVYLPVSVPGYYDVDVQFGQSILSYNDANIYYPATAVNCYDVNIYHKVIALTVSHHDIYVEFESIQPETVYSDTNILFHFYNTFSGWIDIDPNSPEDWEGGGNGDWCPIGGGGMGGGGGAGGVDWGDGGDIFAPDTDGDIDERRCIELHPELVPGNRVYTIDQWEMWDDDYGWVSPDEYRFGISWGNLLGPGGYREDGMPLRRVKRQYRGGCYIQSCQNYPIPYWRQYPPYHWDIAAYDELERTITVETDHGSDYEQYRDFEIRYDVDTYTPYLFVYNGSKLYYDTHNGCDMIRIYYDAPDILSALGVDGNVGLESPDITLYISAVSFSDLLLSACLSTRVTTSWLIMMLKRELGECADFTTDRALLDALDFAAAIVTDWEDIYLTYNDSLDVLWIIKIAAAYALIAVLSNYILVPIFGTEDNTQITSLMSSKILRRIRQIFDNYYDKKFKRNIQGKLEDKGLWTNAPPVCDVDFFDTIEWHIEEYGELLDNIHSIDVTNRWYDDWQIGDYDDDIIILPDD